MHFFKAVLAGTVLVSTVVAQLVINTPAGVVVGIPLTVTYSGGGGNAVTITLKKGLSTNLKTISVLTDSSTSGSYTWTPDPALTDGSDYALQINQGDEINYTAQFAITGGSGTSVSSILSSILSSASSVASSTNATTTASGSGTLPPVTRNTTMSYPTLTPQSTSTIYTYQTGGAETGSGGPGSATSGPVSTGALETSTGGAAGLDRPILLIIAALAAVLYW